MNYNLSWCKKIKQKQNFVTVGGQSSPSLCSSIRKMLFFQFLNFRTYLY